MRKCILIRTYRDEDKLFCKKLLEASVMNQLNHTYIGFLLGLNIMRIVNMLSIVLMSLLMYAGLHKIYCIIVIFIPEIILYISLYAKFLYEARIVGNEVDEISRIYTLDNSSRFWIAEAYEDFSLNNQEQNQQYVFMTEEKMNKKYTRKGIGSNLLNQAQQFADENGILYIKAIVSEFQKHIMYFYNTKNLSVNVIHDKSFLISVTLYEYIFRIRDSH